MGCPLPVLRFIAREHRQRPFSGPVLLLGRQCVYATFAEVTAMLRAEGLVPKPLPSGMSELTNIPSWRDGPHAACTSDEAFFQALGGLETVALDSSAYEGAEIVWDLNQPVPAEHEARFGLILDGGTLEHVFDTRTALANVARMLRPGGRVVHTNPATNYLAHGFYQFSPTFYYDFYGANAFSDLRCYIAEQPSWSTSGHGWRYWEWDTRRPYTNLRAKDLLMTFFTAEKTGASTHDRIPQQGDHLKTGEGGRTSQGDDSAPRGSLGALSAMLPERVRMALRRLRGRDLMSEPWGLKYMGRL